MSQVAKVIGVCMTLASCGPLHFIGTGNLLHSIVTGNTQGVATGIAGKALPKPFDKQEVEQSQDTNTVDWVME